MLLNENKLRKIIRRVILKESSSFSKKTQEIQKIMVDLIDNPQIEEIKVDGKWGPKTSEMWEKWITQSIIVDAATGFGGAENALGSEYIEKNKSNAAKIAKKAGFGGNLQGVLDLVRKIRDEVKDNRKSSNRVDFSKYDSATVDSKDKQDTTDRKLTSVGKEIVKAYPKSEHIAYDIEQVCKRLNMNPFHLANIINFESAGSFSPSQRNLAGGSAVGLIQFITKTAKDLGTTTSELASMTGPEQMKYVEKYFAKVKKQTGADLQKAEDIAMSVFFPLAVGKGPDYNIFEYYIKRYSKPKYKRIKFSKKFLSNRSYQKGIKEFGFKVGDIINPNGSKERATQVAKMVYLYPNGGIQTAGEYTKLKLKNAKLPTKNVDPYGGSASV